MGQYLKLYKNIKNNPYNVEFRDIDKILTKAGGFEVRNSGSSHYVYYHPDLPDNLTIPKKRPVKPIYIKKALEAFDRANPEFEKGEINNDE